MWQGALGVRFTFDVAVFVEHFVTKKTALLGLEQKTRFFFKMVFIFQQCKQRNVQSIQLQHKRHYRNYYPSNSYL